MLQSWRMITMDPAMTNWVIRAIAIALILLTLGNLRVIPVRFPRKTYTLRKSRSLGKFFYATFLKPHDGDAGQQSALESFYKSQADAYDATRRILLRGREDMLGLVAAQLRYKEERGHFKHNRPVWVDIGGGTGYNIEAMQEFVDVPTFFAKIILVDLSPSLLDVARRRFARLGWDVEIVCQDARSFRLSDHLPESYMRASMGVDVITMSYSLSMIPDYYIVLDLMTSLLSSNGIIGVADFYVQSIVEVRGRNYIGGSFNRHVTWIGRLFWRAWFDLDRVGLEGARRDYLEYKFGTLKTVDQRNYLLGGIPYYSRDCPAQVLGNMAYIISLPRSLAQFVLPDKAGF